MTRHSTILIALIAFATACGGETTEGSGDTPNTQAPGGKGDIFVDDVDQGPVVEEPMAEADPNRRTEWGPSSVIDSLTLITDDSCCVDFDNDSLGLTDNALGSVLGLLDEDGSLQASVDDSIGNADLVLLLEHDGIDSANGSFSLNVAQGFPSPSFVDSNTSDAYAFQPDPEGANPYVLDAYGVTWDDVIASSLPATLDNGSIAAQDGLLFLPITLFGITFELEINHARITANIGDATNPDDGTGVALEKGTIAGIVRLSEVYDELNEFSDVNCGCLGLTQDLIPYSSSETIGSASCSAEFDRDALAESCADDPGTDADDFNATCVVIAMDVCQNLGAFGFVLDQYTDDPTQNCLESEGPDFLECDGISLGFEFGAAGATIEGVTAE